MSTQWHRWRWLAPSLLVVLMGCASADVSSSAAPVAGDDTWVASGQGVGGEDASQTMLSGDADDPTKFMDSAAATSADGAGAMSDTSDYAEPSLGLVLPGAQNVSKFRQMVAAGEVPEDSDFPMEGWFNEVGSPLPPADPNNFVDLHALGAIVAQPQAEAVVLLQLGFNTSKMLQELQSPLGLVVLVDTSGSIDAERFEAVRQGILALSDNLPPGSHLAVLGFSTEVQQLWSPAEWQPAARSELAKALSAIKPSGGTDLYAAFEGAAAVLASMPKTLPQHRVLLCSDGSSTQGGHSATDLVNQVIKLGLSLSAIGLGPMPSTALLNSVAKAGQGTYYEAPTSQAITVAFTKDLMTLLMPVAQNLKVEITLAPGWTVADAYGLPYYAQGNVLILGQNSAHTGAGDANSGGADLGAAPADAVDGPDQQGGSATLATTLYPSQHNGMVVLRLQPAAGTVFDQAATLTLAQVAWHFELTSTGTQYDRTTSVQVNGFVQIPDGPLEFFSQPIARRTAALVLLGQAMRQACAGFHGVSSNNQALATLEAGKQFAQQMLDAITPAADDPQASIADALQLAGQLYGNISQKK